MNWFFSIAFLGTACSTALVEDVISSESSNFPDLDVLESVFIRSFENVSYTETLDDVRAQTKGDMPQEKQEKLSYLQHGQHPGNEEVWKLHRVWKAMNNVARQLPQIVSSNIEPKTMSMIRNLCERHARDDIGLEEIDCTTRDYQEYRSIDGTCNNLINTRWGSAAQPFERFLPADYGQGTWSGPFDLVWNDDQCRLITGTGGDGGFSLSGCQALCRRTLNCNAINRDTHNTRCELRECPDPIPAPTWDRGYQGYSSADGFSVPFANIWKTDQCDRISYYHDYSLSDCKSQCLRKTGCTAFNYNEVKQGCDLWACDLPVPVPCSSKKFQGFSFESGNSGLRLTKENSQLPNPRKISRALSESKPRETPKVSLMLMQWGQFLDHDITMTPEMELEEEEGGSKACRCCDKGRLSNSVSLWDDCVPIDVTGDSFYKNETFEDGSKGRECFRFVRSMPTTSGCAYTPREQINGITAFVDGSMVYGSDIDTADFLRTKSQGLLKTTTHGNGQPLPPNGSNQTETGTCPQRESMGSCFLAGDVRVDEIPSLTALHTTFIRLHNIIAQDLAKLKHYKNIDNSKTRDEKLYQETRRIVGALIQQITYRDWLPHVVGPTIMGESHLKPEEDGYKDTYDPEVNPNIRNVFATAAFRFGHTLIAELLKPATTATPDLPLPGHFFDISVIESDDLSPSSLLKGLTRCPAQPIDPVVVRALTDSLFATEEDKAADGNFYGLDLVSLNIQRGRDHGIPSYREWRTFCNLPDITKFEDLKEVMPAELVYIFEQTYSDIDDIDLFPAGLAENKIADGILGPTFSCIIAQQFAKTKHGDRYWFEREDQPKAFTPEQLNSIRSQGLSSILCRVSEHTSFGFQPDPFLNEDQPGNAVKECSSYDFLDLKPWEGACPNTFEELGHTCYKFYDLRVNWGDARDACQELGKKLGEKLDLAELGSNPASGNDILLMQTIAEKGQTVWIGATDSASEGTWKWSTSGRPLSLSNSLWWFHEPNNDGGSQDCLYVHMAGTHDRPTFFDGACSHEFSFVCQVFDQ